MNEPDLDWNEFRNAAAIDPPESATRGLNRLWERPRAWRVAIKLLTLHAVATLAVVYVCPQFGVSWGSSPFSLMPLFMRFGAGVCAAICGALLMGSGLGLGALLLRREESFWVERRLPAVTFGLTAATALLFSALGAEAAHGESVLWMSAALAGGWVFFRIGRRGHLRLAAAAAR